MAVFSRLDFDAERFLGHLKTPSRYDLEADGPYAVAQIDVAAMGASPYAPDVRFGDGVSPHMLSLTPMLHFVASPVAWEIFKGIEALDRALGFETAQTVLEWDGRPCDPGKPHRVEVWHRDVIEGVVSSVPPRLYLAASAAGTLFIRESMTIPSRVIYWPETEIDGEPQSILSTTDHGGGRVAVPKERTALVDGFAREAGALVEAVPGTVYLMTERQWHRGQVMPQGGPRTFLRAICF